MINFDKIVKKVLKKSGKVIFNYDVFELIDPEKKPEYTSLVNKTIYKLRAQKIIIPLRNGVYIVPDEEDKNLNIIDLVEKYFFKLVKKYISYHCWSNYYISWIKSLEFHMKNFSIPEKIFIINRNLNKKIKIGNYELIFKTIKWNKKNNVNLYSRFSKMTKNIEVDWVNLKISNLEMALLESCFISDWENGIDINLITKTLKKYSKVLNVDNFYFISASKYLISVNRLKELSKNIDEYLYTVFIDVIKQNWWNFIWEWLRKI